VFSDLSEIRADLKARLQPSTGQVIPGAATVPGLVQIPHDWTIVDHIAAPHESLVPVLYFEFTGVDSDANGQPLGRDTVACSIDLVIETPRSDAGGAEDDVDSYVLRLAQALQKADDIFWSTARKQRLTDGGHMTWRISLTILCTIAPSEGN
jgi:hypothetical protein